MGLIDGEKAYGMSRNLLTIFFQEIIAPAWVILKLIWLSESNPGEESLEV